MATKKYSSVKIVELVIRGIRDGVNVKQYCAQCGIARSTFYRRKKQVLTQLAQGARRR